MYVAISAYHFGYYHSASALSAWRPLRSAVVVRRAAAIHWTRAVEIEMVEGTDEWMPANADEARRPC